MEIGSFIELDLRNTGEYYKLGGNIARLNSARASIYHAIRLLDCSVIYLPYYLCSVVRDFLLRKGLIIKYYYLSDRFVPLLQENEANSAMLIVNYFGILSNSYISELSKKFRNVLIDNSPAFYGRPLKGCYCIYSPRKFFGVPDGSYLIGAGATRLIEEYEQDYSSETSLFLLKRIEFGSSSVYKDRMLNEHRISNSDVLKMSILTRALLNNVDYESIKTKRQSNFNFAHDIFGHLNVIDPLFGSDKDTVPMVYPLVIEDSTLVEKLKEKRIYTGRLWKHVLSEIKDDSFEAMLSKFLIPIPIDQRYGPKELKYIKEELLAFL